jgi:hypothetical protein
MKKLLLFSFLILCFLGCEKEETYCWDCYIKDNKTDEILKYKSYCDKTADEIILIKEPEYTPGISYRICYKRK